MIDYLSGLAEQAATPSSTVRPTLRPLYADRPIDTSDSRFDDSSSLDEFIDVESPAPWSEAQASQSKEVGEVSGDGPGIPASTGQSAFRPMLGRSHEVEGPSARDSASEFAEPNELRSSFPPLRQQPEETVQPEVTVRSVPRVESHLVQQPTQRTLVDVQRPETSSFKAASHSSDIRRDHPLSGNHGLQSITRTALESDEGAPSSPHHVKTALAEQQELSGGTVNSVVEIQSERESKLPLRRLQTGGRAKEIIPLSTTTPLPTCPARSQTVSLPAIQPAAETIVHVTIGRVEVRATVGSQKPVAGREPSTRQSSQSLEDYLRGTSSGRSS